MPDQEGRPLSELDEMRAKSQETEFWEPIRECLIPKANEKFRVSGLGFGILKQLAEAAADAAAATTTTTSTATTTTTTTTPTTTITTTTTATTTTTTTNYYDDDDDYYHYEYYGLIRPCPRPR